MPKHHATCSLEGGQLCSADNMDRHYALHRYRTCLGLGGCHWVIHAMVFFDGTGNKRERDENYGESTHCPSNIAKLARLADVFYSAWSRSSRYLGDPAIHDPSSYELVRPENLGKANGLLRVAQPLYIPGVGTPYSDDQTIWENLRDSVTLGGALARGFGIRLEGARSEFRRRITRIIDTMPESSKPGKVVLHVVGFSRGATLARTFVNTLLKDYPQRNNYGTPLLHDLAAQIEHAPELHIQSLGLFNTVASIGLPGKVGGALLDIPAQVNNCLHLVAAHECRDYFPLSSIAGNRAQNSGELIYPGVHSDIGGGYKPNEQGKANEMTKVTLVEMLHFLWDNGAPILSFDELARFEAATGDELKDLFRDFDYPDAMWDAVQYYREASDETSPVQSVGDLKTRIFGHMETYHRWRGRRDKTFASEKERFSNSPDVITDLHAIDNYDYWLNQLMNNDFLEGDRRVIKRDGADITARPMRPEEKRWHAAWIRGRHKRNEAPTTAFEIISNSLFDQHIHDSVAGFGMVGAEQYMALRGIVPDDGSPVDLDAPRQAFRSPYGPRRKNDERIAEIAQAPQGANPVRLA